MGGAYKIAELIKKAGKFDAKVCVLGHIQRGGSPTAIDRTNASRLGAAAVEELLKGQCDVMIGLINNELKTTPFKDSFTKKKNIQKELIALENILSI